LFCPEGLGVGKRMVLDFVLRMGRHSSQLVSALRIHSGDYLLSQSSQSYVSSSINVVRRASVALFQLHGVSEEIGGPKETQVTCST
jgi:hypothetical protein